MLDVVVEDVGLVLVLDVDNAVVEDVGLLLALDVADVVELVPVDALVDNVTVVETVMVVVVVSSLFQCRRFEADVFGSLEVPVRDAFALCESIVRRNHKASSRMKKTRLAGSMNECRY